MNFLKQFYFSRTIDLKYPSNIFIVIFSGVTFLSTFGLFSWSGNNYLESFAAAVSSALYVFLIWAIIREIDPDHPKSAVIGTFLAFSFALILENKELLLLTTIMLSVRILSLSVGYQFRIFELIIIILLISFLSYSSGFFVPMLMILVFGLNYLLTESNKTLNLVGALSSFIIFAVNGFLGVQVEFSLPDIEVLVISTIAFLLSPFVVKKVCERVESKCDQTENKILELRIAASYVFFQISLFILVFIPKSKSAVFAMSICIVGIALTHIFRKVRISNQ